MKQNTDADEAQNMTVATFDNKNTGETIEVVGEIVGRDSRYDWSNERVKVEAEDGNVFTFYMGDTYETRRVKANGTSVGHWTAFLA